MNNNNKMRKNERLGETNVSKEQYIMKIVEYKNNRNIVIEFQDEHKARVPTTYQNFKDGLVKNPYHKSVYGVGYIGEGEYKTSEKGKHTVTYKIWSHMLQRCYDPYTINKHPTYIDCYVCEEWHNFQNFAEWYYKNYYEIENEKMHLDKDILCKGNKTYSPETCIFVSNRINCLFTKSDKMRGSALIGVYWYKRDKIFVAKCNDANCKQQYLGRFDKELDAFYAYKQFKEKVIKQVADEYKDLIPQKLYDALYKWEVEIND